MDGVGSSSVSGGDSKSCFGSLEQEILLMNLIGLVRYTTLTYGVPKFNLRLSLIYYHYLKGISIYNENTHQTT